MSLLKEKPKVGKRKRKRKRENGNRKTTMCTKSIFNGFLMTGFQLCPFTLSSFERELSERLSKTKLQRRLALRNAVCFRSALGRIFL
jgi:hypothetical protein